MSKWSSQATASRVTLTKSSRSPSYFLSWQSIIRCCIDCMVAPQSHSGLSLNFHLCISSLHLPCPVRILLSLLSLSQVFLGRSMPKTGVSTLSIWIPPSLSYCHSVFHTLRVFSLISVMIRTLNKNDFRDLSLRVYNSVFVYWQLLVFIDFVFFFLQTVWHNTAIMNQKFITLPQ